MAVVYSTSPSGLLPSSPEVAPNLWPVNIHLYSYVVYTCIFVELWHSVDSPSADTTTSMVPSYTNGRGTLRHTRVAPTDTTAVLVYRGA